LPDAHDVDVTDHLDDEAVLEGAGEANIQGWRDPPGCLEENEAGAPRIDLATVRRSEGERLELAVRDDRALERDGPLVRGGADDGSSVVLARKERADDGPRRDDQLVGAAAHADLETARRRALVHEQTDAVGGRDDLVSESSCQGLREVERETRVARGERPVARTREPGEAHRGVRLDGDRSRALVEHRELAEVVAGPDRPQLHRATTEPRLAFEHEVHVLARVPLADDGRAVREGDLVEQVEESSELAHAEPAEKPRAPEDIEVVESLAVDQRQWRDRGGHRGLTNAPVQVRTGARPRSRLGQARRARRGPTTA